MAHRLVSMYKNLNSNTKAIMKLGFVFFPFALYILLSIFNFSTALKYLFMTLGLSSMGIIYSFYIMIDILTKETGTGEM